MLAVFRYWPWLPAMALLASCSTIQPVNTAPPATEPASYKVHLLKLQSIEQFKLKGRIGVQTEARGFSGSMLWLHQPSNDDIALFSPLGSQVASILANPGHVRLINSDGAEYHETSAERLTQKNLGWSLPMNGLSDWVLGRPNNTPINFIQWDDAGHISRLHQDGWEIEFSQYTTTDNTSLPGRIFLRSPKVNLKFVVESWSLNSLSNAPY